MWSFVGARRRTTSSMWVSVVVWPIGTTKLQGDANTGWVFRARAAMAGFRTSSSGGGSAKRQFGTGHTGSAPFSQAQIIHLMKTEFARGRRYGFPVSCILIQVDRLRALVDIHGTDLEAAVRTELGRLVANRTRGADQLGLVSDDRYLLVLPHASEAAAVTVAERLRRDFGELEVKSRGSVLALSLSLGVASCDDQDTLFFDTMLSRAEAAMTWAGEAGGDCVEVFRADRIN